MEEPALGVFRQTRNHRELLLERARKFQRKGALVEREELIETVIEVIWCQTAPDEWFAILRNPWVEEYHEVHTPEEFGQALQLLCQADPQPA
jgi:hypothetical protein